MMSLTSVPIITARGSRFQMLSLTSAKIILARGSHFQMLSLTGAVIIMARGRSFSDDVTYKRVHHYGAWQVILR